MKNIFKYPISNNSILLPTNATVVKVGIQDGSAFVWIEHDLTQIPKYPRNYKIFGTGHDIPDSAIWQGTFFDAPFVWHVYEVVE